MIFATNVFFSFSSVNSKYIAQNAGKRMKKNVKIYQNVFWNQDKSVQRNKIRDAR